MKETIAKNEKTRLGIFVFYEKEGIAEDYVIYLLEEIRKNVTDLIVVCNGIINAESRKKIEEITSEVHIRENKGFDAEAWKECFIDFLGWEKTEKYDEILIANDTVYGPFYPLSDVFSAMDKRDIDFWGITMHGESKDPYGKNSYGYFPSHIQSYFICIRKKMHASYHFHKFWEELPPIMSYEDAVSYCETTFTKYFSDKGFSWDVFVDMRNYIKKRKQNYNINTHEMADLLINRNSPFIKKKNFILEKEIYLAVGDAGGLKESLRHITQNTEYDEGMIWKNLLRTENVRDIYEKLCLDFCLPEICVSEIPQKKKIAFIIHAYNQHSFDKIYKYAMSIPEHADIYITASSKRNKKILEDIFDRFNCGKLEIRYVEPRGRALSALLVECNDVLMEYDYLCFVHSQWPFQNHVQSIGADYTKNIFENMLASKGYVLNIIDLFEKNKNLGLLIPPRPYHSLFIKSLGNEWTKNFDNTRQLLEKLGIEVDMDRKKDPITIQNAFWCRPDALKPLFDKSWTYKDFLKEPRKHDDPMVGAIERSYAYIAQSRGYYTGIIYNTSYASLIISNQTYMFRNIAKMLREMTGLKGGNYKEYLNRLKKIISKKRIQVTEPFGTYTKRKIKKMIPSSIKRMRKKHRNN